MNSKALENFLIPEVAEKELFLILKQRENRRKLNEKKRKGLLENVIMNAKTFFQK